MEKILVTGSAGFIGFHTVLKFVKSEYEVIGADNINDYYEPGLKYARLEQAGFSKNEIADNEIIESSKYPNCRFIKADLTDYEAISGLFKSHNFDVVINLAAQPGIRYSLENPFSYINSNITGFLTILECCRNYGVKHLIFASSSSVYGANIKQPFSVTDRADKPISLYAATKKSDELMAYSYSRLFGIPSTGLRFFTVYGPWGRPDMAYFKFTKNILEGKTIDVYNHGKMKRDFTYIDDITECLSALVGKAPEPSGEEPPYRLFNIGNNKTVELMAFISALEKICGKTANINFMPVQPGDVLETYADIDELKAATGFSPSASIEKGLNEFVSWYRDYYNII